MHSGHFTRIRTLLSLKRLLLASVQHLFIGCQRKACTVGKLHQPALSIKVMLCLIICLYLSLELPVLSGYSCLCLLPMT